MILIYFTLIMIAHIKHDLIGAPAPADCPSFFQLWKLCAMSLNIASVCNVITPILYFTTVFPVKDQQTYQVINHLVPIMTLIVEHTFNATVLEQNQWPCNALMFVIYIAEIGIYQKVSGL
jgi:phage-related holin